MFGLSRIMSQSQDTLRQVENSSAALAILGVHNYKPHFQFYNFAEKKWSLLQKIDDGEFGSAAVLKEKFYFVTETESDEKIHFQVFDLATRRSTTLHPPNPILAGSSMCTDGRFLYFCGGRNSDGSATSQVRKYDPQSNTFETLPPMPSKRWGPSAIFNQGCLYVLGGYDSPVVLSVDKYDPKTKEWTTLKPLERLGEGVGVLDGKLYVCGGDCNYTVDVYDPTNDSWQEVARMNKSRIDCLAVDYEGKLLVIGGDEERTVEAYDPRKNQWRMDEEMSAGLRMRSCFGGLVSAGSVAHEH